MRVFASTAGRAGRHDEARDRLVDHVVARRRRIVAGRPGWDTGVVRPPAGVYDNAVAALRWCLAHDDDGTRALTLCAVLWGVVHQGHTDEIAALWRRRSPAGPIRGAGCADAIATAATARS